MDVNWRAIHLLELGNMGVPIMWDCLPRFIHTPIIQGLGVNVKAQLKWVLINFNNATSELGFGNCRQVVGFAEVGVTGNLRHSCDLDDGLAPYTPHYAQVLTDWTDL